MSKLFIDTNILVYTLDKHDLSKQECARNLVRDIVLKAFPVISTQVLQEFYSAATVRLKADKLLVKNILHNYKNMEIVQVDLGVIEQGIDISILSQISFCDGLIIAAAEQANCEYIISEDMSAGQSIRGVTIINPFEYDRLDQLL